MRGENWVLSILCGLLIFGAGGMVKGITTPPHEPETYRIAAVICDETEQTSWDIGICQWKAYEKFYGTDAAEAAWEKGRQKEVQP